MLEIEHYLVNAVGFCYPDRKMEVEDFKKMLKKYPKIRNNWAEVEDSYLEKWLDTVDKVGFVYVFVDRIHPKKLSLDQLHELRQSPEIGIRLFGMHGDNNEIYDYPTIKITAVIGQ